MGRRARKPIGGGHHSQWQPVRSVGNAPPRGRFIHLVFELDNGKQLVLSDLRKFAEVLCGAKQAILDLPEIRNLGPEPLAPEFTFLNFERLFTRKGGTLKRVLMDPTFIAGIDNLYSDEVLYVADCTP